MEVLFSKKNSIEFEVVDGIFKNYYGMESKEVTIPEDVVEIGDFAFSTRKLTGVILHEGIEKIGKGAFHLCSAITSILLPNNLKSIDILAFSSTGLEKIEIPQNVIRISESAFSDIKSLREINVSKKNKSFRVEEACLIDNKNSTLLRACNLPKITIPKGITFIGKGAFSSCDNVLGIVFTSSLTKIKESAFDKCNSLTSIVIPENVTSIEKYAFANCKGLKDVVILGNINKIERSTFLSCSNLTTLKLPNGLESIGIDAFVGCVELTSVLLPEGLGEIKQAAFYRCTSLKSIVIPVSLAKIGAEAFFKCEVETIFYRGENDKENHLKKLKNKISKGAEVYFYSKTEPKNAGNFWFFDTNGNPKRW